MALSTPQEQLWSQAPTSVTGVCNGVILRSALDDSIDQKDSDSVETTSSNSDSGSRRLKNMRDPSSHRMIEKRRRDRMNNCLASLSKLIPQAYLNKSRGRVEKTEIIEMAIKYIKHVRATSKAAGAATTSAAAPSKPCSDLNAPLPSAKSGQSHSQAYETGYNQCKADVQRYLMTSDGATVNSNFVASTMAQLDPKTSGGQQSPQASPVQHKVQDQPLNMSLKAHVDTRPSPTNSPEKSTTSSSSIYPSSPGSFQSNISGTPPRSVTPPYHVHKVPVFALHSSGLFYTADYVHRSALLACEMHDEHNVERQRSECHPVSIPVRFGQAVMGAQVPTHQSPPAIMPASCAEKPRDLSLHPHRNSAFDLRVKPPPLKPDYASPLNAQSTHFSNENHRFANQGQKEFNNDHHQMMKFDKRDWTQALANFDPGQRIAAHFGVK